MKKIRRVLVPLILIAAAAGAYVYAKRRPSSLVLTGVVTTNDVIVSPQIAGQLQKLLVKEEDTVKKGQLLAVIVPDELAADTAYYTQARAVRADLENARLQYNRTRALAENRIASPQEVDQARTTFDAAQAKVEALVKQVDAQRAAVRLARA